MCTVYLSENYEQDQIYVKKYIQAYCLTRFKSNNEIQNVVYDTCVVKYCLYMLIIPSIINVGFTG